MKVILLSDQRHTGRRGEIVQVKPGYARNFLLPRGLASLATPGNIKSFEQQRAKIDAQHAAEMASAVAAAAEIEGVKVSLTKRATDNETLYGSVSPSEIEDALAAKGIKVDRRDIDLAGGIKTLGDHPVRISLHPEVTAEIRVLVEPEG